ncbi:hypothetical protein K432DRAFT_386612 [Lepidopterella palustris CBS 459.81]|uniref:Uncharacterized protein n=1 Tax=Lepidopterella palustris CBS 459.81 TaxID=1314670 RepID=A0A8E2J9Y4_9PEZI|nr:hypothetical protein K432DRAFT_386612 [Lepidopterella palustris CBS 459.81]
MVVGLDILAAIAAIISASTAIAELVADRKKKRKAKTDGANHSVDGLEAALNRMRSRLESEYGKLKRTDPSMAAISRREFSRDFAFS